MKQISNSLLMIEPISFGFNPQTAAGNFFQQNDAIPVQIQQNNALSEFKGMVARLETEDIQVITIKDSVENDSPSSLFPSNWLSFHETGDVVLYPLFAPNRRRERRKNISEVLRKSEFHIREIVDYSASENQNCFLEGSGSMVLDRKSQVAYMACSERSNEQLFKKFCNEFQFEPFIFHSHRSVEIQPIHHTDFLLFIADDYAVICLECIDLQEEKRLLMNILKQCNKNIIPISTAQMHHFAGNMVQVENRMGERLLVMSQSANGALIPAQLEALESHNRIVSVDIPTIQKYGGGGVKSMVAEIFLPKTVQEFPKSDVSLPAI